MDLWKEFHGPNAAYVQELYDRYRADPDSVDAATRAAFDRWDGTAPTSQKLASLSAAARSGGVDPMKAAAVFALAQAIRNFGHLDAQLDPLGSPPPGDPALLLETHGLTEDDLRALPAGLVGGVTGERVGQNGGSAYEAIAELRTIYCSRTGFDFIQVRVPAQRDWLQEAVESRRFSVQAQPVDDRALLDRLTQVEAFEHFLQRSFVAKTRFSIEGLDMMVPLLDEVIGCAAESGIYNILLGMAHRGRLNVLAHVLGKPYNQILAEFKDPLRRRSMQNEPTGWAGDVKYHAGARHTLDDNDPETIDLTIQMAPNPSHLEAVNPVVEGMARAAGTDASQPGKPSFNPAITLPVLIHGDASFPGQGVVPETLNMYRLDGYHTGGTVHVIANNQIGFTTGPFESRSTLFASDLAKGFRMAIVHVNADDPEAVIEVARMAFAFRQEFNRDFVIDLIGYRRLGHNEGDEPEFTQPEMYRQIQQQPSVRKLWAAALVERGTVEEDLAERIYNERMQAFQQELEKLDPETALEEPIPTAPPRGAARKMPTAVPAERITRLHKALLQTPEGFTVHPRLARIRQRREGMMDDPEKATVDWSAAEELALATILEDGIPIRVTGQDVERGTFSHRHAVLNDAATGAQFVPLQELSTAKAGFEIYNSPLSEYAALGFEFGYNVQAPGRLVIWEAQYGDFINNAQTVVDEFIASARDKWGQLPSLVLLLPHGYEGQGPDHSSGRLERFLGLAADFNLRVMNCTTAANYFHLLRRQAALLPIDPLPLVIMTPKSILRNPLVASPPHALAEGGWQAVIAPQPLPVKEGQEPIPLPQPEEIRRLILCSGKVYLDLVTSEIAPQHAEVGVARLEQLAPFPVEDARALIDAYPNLEELRWVQEEPENMGAWEWVRPHLEELLAGKAKLTSVARPRSSTPAEGSNNQHQHNQRRLIEQAFAEEPAAGGENGRSKSEQKPIHNAMENTK